MRFLVLLLALTTGLQAKPSYSGGSTSKPSPKPSVSAPKPSYSAPKPSAPKPTIDSGYGKARQVEQSTRSYTERKSPAPTYKTNSGETKTIPKNDKEFENLKKTSTTYSQPRERRKEIVYEQVHHYPAPTVQYHDPYNHLFMMWLLTRPVETQATWIHNHRDSVDQARIDDLYKKNDALRSKVKELENKDVDPTYVPEGMDTDLMYNDDYVTSAENHGSGVTFWGVCKFFLVMIAIFSAIVAVWFVFCYKWLE